MKKISSLIVIALFAMLSFTCCNNTTEYYAKHVIDSCLVNNLNDKSSYEDVSTEIDTIHYEDIYGFYISQIDLNPDIKYKYVVDTLIDDELLNIIAPNNKNDIDVNGIVWYYMKEQYFYNLAEDVIKQRYKTNKNPKDIYGYLVTHKYRANNNFNTKILSTFRFILPIKDDKPLYKDVDDISDDKTPLYL